MAVAVAEPGATGPGDHRRARAQVAALLDELADGAFVVGAPGDRYEVRPLLAGYARMHLRDTEPVRRRVTVQARLTRHLARRAEQQVAALAAGALDRDQRLPDDDPYGWLDLHQELLLAVVQVPAGAVETLPRRVRNWWFRLAVALCGWLAHTERLDEWEDVCRTVLANPTAQDRPEIAGWAHNELGVLRRRRHDPYGAVAALSLAVAGQGRRGPGADESRAGPARPRSHRRGGGAPGAVAAAPVRRRPRRPGAQRSRAGCGEAGAVRAGHRARPAGSGANSFRSLGDARGYAAALTNLVLVHSAMGEHLDAAQAWRAALREYESLGDPSNRAVALLNAGVALLGVAPGQARQAYELLAESWRLREGGRPDAGLGRTLLHLGDAAAALGAMVSGPPTPGWAVSARPSRARGDDGGYPRRTAATVAIPASMADAVLAA